MSPRTELDEPRLTVPLHSNPDGEADRHCAVGLAAHEAGRVAAAIPHYHRALAQTPSHLSALYLLGAAHQHQGDTAAAQVAGDRGLAIDHLHVPAATLSGLARLDRGDTKSAGRLLRRALASGPSDFHALNNMALADRGALFLECAILRHKRSLAVSPGNRAARWNLVNARLLGGAWPDAWRDFELRHEIQGSYPHSLTGPQWAGERQPGRLLIHDEIGYGDVFNFLRYVPMARTRVGSVILEVKPGLERLLAGYPGIDRLIIRGAQPPSPDQYDVYSPLESLPGIFNTEVSTVPEIGPTPKPTSRLLQHWSNRLAQIKGPRIAIAWAGNPGSQLDLTRSCPFENLIPIIARSGLQTISVQKGSPVAPSTLTSLGVHDISAELADFADTAAVLSLVDAVLTVETSVAHLAGVLGRPTIVLLPFVPAWRWLLGRNDTPWYPTVHLARQPSASDWQGAVAIANPLLGSILRAAPRTP